MIAQLELAPARREGRLHGADQRQAMQRALEEHHVAEHVREMHVRQPFAQSCRLAGEHDERRVGPGRPLVEVTPQPGEVGARESFLLDERSPDAIPDAPGEGEEVSADVALDVGGLQKTAGALRVAPGRGQDDDRTDLGLPSHVGLRPASRLPMSDPTPPT